MSNIVLVEELFIDSLENKLDRAMVYEPIGYVVYGSPAYHAYRNAWIEGTGWPIARGDRKSKYRLNILHEVFGP